MGPPAEHIALADVPRREIAPSVERGERRATEPGEALLCCVSPPEGPAVTTATPEAKSSAVGCAWAARCSAPATITTLLPAVSTTQKHTKTRSFSKHSPPPPNSSENGGLPREWGLAIGVADPG